MLHSQEYQSIIEAFYEAKDSQEIQGVLEHLTYFLGFRHFAIGHHVDLLNPPSTSCATAGIRGLLGPILIC